MKKTETTPPGLSFKTETTVLKKALARIKGVVERRNTIPILANVMITVLGGVITLTGTDMEITLAETISGHAARDGGCTVGAGTLFAMVAKMPAGEAVEVSHAGGDGGLSVRCGAFETILFVLPVEDFPTSAAVDLPVRFSIPAQSLRTLIDRTVFAISTEETRYYLNGIYMHVVDGALRAVATDGHRMAIMDQPLPDGAAEMKGVIIPRKTVAELRKLLAKYNGDVCIAAGGSGKIRIEFTIPGISLMSKAIDGTYPDYQRIIPTANDRMMQVGNKAFSEALGRVSAVSTERSRPVKMTLSKDTLVLASRNHNEGEAAEKLNGGSVVYAGDPVEIGFQARYLRDVLGAIGRDVSFSFVDGQSPTLIGDGDGMFTGILMPMRI